MMRLLFIVMLPVWIGASCPSTCRCSDVKLICTKFDSNDVPPLAPTLKTVKISGGDMKHLRNASFSSSPLLEKLYLSSNKITIIEEGAFSGIVNLKELNLIDNNLSYISPMVFEHLPNLAKLHLSNNCFRTIPPFAIRSLTRLNLNANEIKELIFPSSYLESRKLRSVIITNNKITKIGESAFINLPEVSSIDLDNNNISWVHPRAFLPIRQTLQMFSLDHAPLNSSQWINLFKSLVVTESKLKVVKIRFNRLKKLERSLFIPFKTAKITNLHLDKSPYKSISPDAFEGVEKSLYILGLSFCGLSDQMHQINFTRFEKLRTLDLSDNKLTEIPATLPSSLRELKLQNNSISNIRTDAFHSTTGLTKIDLRSNRITNISPAGFILQSSLQLLDLTGNPFKCDCELFSFVKWFKNNRLLFGGKEYKSLKCSSGEILKDIALKRCPLKRTKENVIATESYEYSVTTGNQSSNISGVGDSTTVSPVRSENASNSQDEPKEVGRLPKNPQNTTSSKDSILNPLIVGCTISFLLIVVILVVVVIIRVRMKMARERRNRQLKSGCDGIHLLETPTDDLSMERSRNSCLIENSLYSNEREEPIGSAFPEDQPGTQCDNSLQDSRIICASADRELVDVLIQEMRNCRLSKEVNIKQYQDTSDISDDCIAVIASSPSLFMDADAMQAVENALKMNDMNLLKLLIVLEIDEDRMDEWRQKTVRKNLRVIPWKLGKQLTLYNLQQEFFSATEHN